MLVAAQVLTANEQAALVWAVFAMGGALVGLFLWLGRRIFTRLDELTADNKRSDSMSLEWRAMVWERLNQWNNDLQVRLTEMETRLRMGERRKHTR